MEAQSLHKLCQPVAAVAELLLQDGKPADRAKQDASKAEQDCLLLKAALATCEELHGSVAAFPAKSAKEIIGHREAVC